MLTPLLRAIAYPGEGSHSLRGGLLAGFWDESENKASEIAGKKFLMRWISQTLRHSCTGIESIPRSKIETRFAGTKPNFVHHNWTRVNLAWGFPAIRAYRG
jgi:hypothetical protein